MGGQGETRRPGSAYLNKVRRQIMKVFVVPPLLSVDELRTLRFRVLVTQMDGRGNVVVYKVLKRSGTRSYDAAAQMAIRAFSPSEGGRLQLPEPSADVLRYINRKGMKITLDGGYLAR